MCGEWHKTCPSSCVQGLRVQLTCQSTECVHRACFLRQFANPVAADLGGTQYPSDNTCCVAMQHPDIYGVLLELADHSDVPDVRASAVQLLNSLPTHSQVLKSIRAALQGPKAAQDLESLLCSSQDAPTKLLYTLQVSPIAMEGNICMSTSKKVYTLH